MAVIPFGDKRPELAPDAFVHDSAVVMGDVHVHERASIWPCAVLRADDDRIDIGKYSAVLDLALLEAPAGKPVTVGEECLISHGAKLHGCAVMKGSLVGIGAILLDGATVGEGSVIAAGALVLPETRIPPGSFVIGVPGKVVREASPGERRFVFDEVRHVFDKAQVYRGRA
jgi:carbonic anhydrase/acetyltransferase-like protein (isoleucine patch superfamily)